MPELLGRPLAVPGVGVGHAARFLVQPSRPLPPDPVWFSSGGAAWDGGRLTEGVGTRCRHRLGCPGGPRRRWKGACVLLGGVATRRELHRGGWFDSRGATDQAGLLGWVLRSSVYGVR